MGDLEGLVGALALPLPHRPDPLEPGDDGRVGRHPVGRPLVEERGQRLDPGAAPSAHVARQPSLNLISTCQLRTLPNMTMSSMRRFVAITLTVAIALTAGSEHAEVTQKENL